MVKLRLRRAGKKKQPFYKVVAADIRSPRDGRYLEAVGSYDPRLHPPELKFKEERVFHWLRNGAQPTDTVRSLFRRSGIWLRWTLTKRGVDNEKMQGILEKWQLAQQDRPKRDSDRKARRAERKKKAAAAEVKAKEAPATQTAEAPAAPASEAPPAS
ncbi:MAG: 30S ribosomal protein S16 [Bacteroidota bacterium]